MSDVATKPREQQYDEATIQRALIEIAACSGNTRMACRKLAEDEVEIPRATLEYWRLRRFAAEYQRIRSEQLPKLREQAADRHAALEERALSISEQAADLVEARLPSMGDKELIDAKYKASLESGIHGDKRLLFEGQPNSIVQRTSAEIMRELKSMGADDVVDAQVISEEDVKDNVS